MNKIPSFAAAGVAALVGFGLQAETVVVSNPADCATVATAVKVHAGDTITLPAISEPAFYKVLNLSFLKLEGTTLTALKPGIVGVEVYDTDGETVLTTMAVFVLPEKIGNGNIFIKKDTSETWNKASSWLNVDGTEASDYPHSVDDIAIIPDSATWKCYMPIPQDCVLGGLYFGRFVNAEGGIVLRNNSLTFKRSDGEPVIIQACSNNLTDEKSSAGVQFGDGATSFIYESDTIFDGGWDGVHSKKTYCAPSYKSNSPHEIKAGVTLTFRNFPSKGTSMGSTFTAPPLKGTGTIWNRSAANIKYETASDEFTGVIRDSSHGNESTDRSGPTYFHKAAVTNASAEAYGFVYKKSDATPVCDPLGAGMLCTGWDPNYNSPGFHGNYLPERGLTLVNSTFRCGSTENKWGVGIAEVKHAQKFTVGRGFSYVYRHNNRSNKDGYPINWFETDALVHQDKGTIRFDDLFRSDYDSSSPIDTTNNVTIIHNRASQMVGAGDPLTSESYPIIPWMVTRSKHSNNGSIAFTCFDANDRICDMMTRTSRELQSVTDPAENVFSKDNQSIVLNEDLTINSLWMNNNNAGANIKAFGADRTLTITSGGVILNGGGSGFGIPGDDSVNGTLVLGDATHPGYVFAETGNSPTKPAVIHAKVIAPGGLVFGYTGYALLTGDQTGVDDELVINAGTLDLGSQDKTIECKLDVPVRILANATVKLNKVDMRNSIVYFDDIAGYHGKIELNADETKCHKLYSRDTPEETEWTSLARGTYGATGSGAEFIDDDRFSGTGVLVVRHDDNAVGLKISVR